MRVLALLMTVVTPASSNYTVAVDGSRVLAKTSEFLTSVTIDVCVAKQRFPFDDKDLLGLTAHLGGSVLTSNPKP